MVDVLRQVWKRETGTDRDTIPQYLGKFQLGSDEYSIGLALQQIASYLRTGSEPWWKSRCHDEPTYSAS
jgi:hypothetical protein